MPDKTEESSLADWEGEGGASEPPEPTQKTPKGLESPVPKRWNLMDAIRKIVGASPKKP